MKKYFLGIDLGSTTSKAVIINEEDRIIGRGITNTRANYTVATEIARLEAIYNARFTILKMKLDDEIKTKPEYRRYINDVESLFQYIQFKRRLDRLNIKFRDIISATFKDELQETISGHIDDIVKSIGPAILEEYLNHDLGAKNQFFRDMISEKYNKAVTSLGKEFFEPMMLVYDKSITAVENELTEYDFRELVYQAMELLNDKYAGIGETCPEESSISFDSELNLLKGNFKQVMIP